MGGSLCGRVKDSCERLSFIETLVRMSVSLFSACSPATSALRLQASNLTNEAICIVRMFREMFGVRVGQYP